MIQILGIIHTTTIKDLLLGLSTAAVTHSEICFFTRLKPVKDALWTIKFRLTGTPVEQMEALRSLKLTKLPRNVLYCFLVRYQGHIRESAQ